MKCPVCDSYSTFKKLDMKVHIYEKHDRLQIIDSLISYKEMAEDYTLDD